LTQDTTRYVKPIIVATTDLQNDEEETWSIFVYPIKDVVINTAWKSTALEVWDADYTRNISFFTDCYEIVNTTNMQIKSLYSYIDFTYKYHRIPNGLTSSQKNCS